MASAIVQVFLDDVDPALRSKPAHQFNGFYIDYPDEERERTRGLVTTVSDDPPMLNWIYCDKDTLELKYGNRTQSRPHQVGPWSWTGDRVGLTLEGVEAFVAVQEEEGNGWSVYYDRDDDMLGQRGKNQGKRRRVLPVSLERKVLEPPKEPPKEKEN